MIGLEIALLKVVIPPGGTVVINSFDAILLIYLTFFYFFFIINYYYFYFVNIIYWLGIDLDLGILAGVVKWVLVAYGRKCRRFAMTTNQLELGCLDMIL